ncbi:MAG: TIGR00730 family Rossman fold protein [Thermoanaerobaculia bacterium]|nr:TIGR00730 family Rossman fold protein [Thermoanaerobaculia bacterium]
MKKVCVFCGSKNGANPAFSDAARHFGERLAYRGHTLVYGGGNLGLMGTVADAVLSGGGEVIGVIPAALEEREHAHTGLTELHVVDSMHERKAMMADLSDAFVALPGGLGTLEELFEVWTWGQLGLHGKPVGLLNVEGFWDLLIGMIEYMCASDFVQDVHRDMLRVHSDPDLLFDSLETYDAPPVRQWIDRKET